MRSGLRTVLLVQPPYSLPALFTGFSGFDFTDLTPTTSWGSEGFKLLYQDLIGTPVSATGQALGVLLDKSQNLAEGAELVVNGNFASGTGWTLDTGWSISGGFVSHVAGVAGDVVGNILTQPIGDTFRAGFAMSSRSAGSMFVKAPISTLSVSVTVDGTYAYAGIAVVANQPVRLACSATFIGSATAFSVRRITANSAYQTSSGSRGTYNISGAVQWMASDGGDDGWFTNLVPAPSMTIAACFRASGASQNVMGSAVGAASRCYLATDASGVLGGGWGSDSPSTITGGPVISGTDVVALLRANATTVELWLNGVKVYSGAANGTANTTLGIALAARNVSGTLGNFLNGRIYRALAVQRFIPDNWVIPMMRQLAAGVVTF